MTDGLEGEARGVRLAIEIAAPPDRVWAALTDPEALRRWMADEHAPLEIELDPVVGGRAVFRRASPEPIEARGVVTALEPMRRLAYTHLADISALPERPESYATLVFRLAPIAAGTHVTLDLCDAPTESIEKHLVFYWRTTLEMLRRDVEPRAPA
ncbi:MAG: SRPBCC domain-containing protein [Sandaracinus sp.]